MTQTPMIGAGSKPGADEFHFQMFILVRLESGISEIDMGLDKPLNVSELPADSVWFSGPLKDQREVSHEITLLASGNYLLVPFTSQAGCMASFTVRAWAKDSPVALFDLDEDEVRTRVRIERKRDDEEGDWEGGEGAGRGDGGSRGVGGERSGGGGGGGGGRGGGGRGGGGRGGGGGGEGGAGWVEESKQPEPEASKEEVGEKKSSSSAAAAAAAAAASTGGSKAKEKEKDSLPGALTFSTKRVEKGREGGGGKEKESGKENGKEKEGEKRNSAIVVSTGPSAIASAMPKRSPRNSKRLVKKPSVKATLPGPPPPAAPEM